MGAFLDREHRAVAEVTAATNLGYQNAIDTKRGEDFLSHTSANISALAERCRCPEGSVSSHSPSLSDKKIPRA